MFDSIAPEMINDFTKGEVDIYNYLTNNIEPGKLIPPLVLRRFSQLAFLLALRSLRTDVVIPAAVPLKKVFKDIIDSKYVSIETKDRLRIDISDALLDFSYASGNHKMTSFRMMPFVINNSHPTERSSRDY